MPDTHIIVLIDADAGTVQAEHNDKIIWRNGTDLDITLAPPSCVAPPDTSLMAPGEDSKKYTVNTRRKKKYPYVFTVGPAVAPRNGKIEI